MKRKKIIIILAAVLPIVLLLALYFGLKQNPSSTGADLGGVESRGQSSSSGLGGQNSPTTRTATSTESTTTPTSNNNVLVIPRLRQLTTVPTSGDIILTRLADVIKDRVKVKETQYFVRYMDRATGHIFDIKTDALAPLEISNTTIPKVYEAVFVPSGNSLLTRSLSNVNPDQILTYYVTMKDKKPTIATSTDTKQTVANVGELNKNQLKDVSGVYLTPDIKEFALSPSGSKVLTLVYSSTGGKIRLSDPNGSNEKTALNHPLREWLLAMPSENKAVLTTKPSGTVNGFAYVLDFSTGNLQKIVGEIAGLTLLPNKDGNTYLGAGTPGGAVKLFAYFAKEGKQTILPFSTFPEKCIWSNKDKFVAYCAVPQSIPASTYPDIWYQGRILFTDDIWKINVSTGETNLISNLPKESGQKIDAINMKLSDDDTYLTFINKVDLTLWGLNLAMKK